MSWSLHGCIVLDRLFGVNRCDEVEVYYEAELPPKDAVRGLASNSAPIRYVRGSCPTSFCFDRIGLGLGEGLYFVDSGLPVLRPAGEWLSRPLGLEVSIQDVVRLRSLIHRYPELEVPPGLMALASAAYSYALERSSTDPDAALLLAKYDS